MPVLGSSAASSDLAGGYAPVGASRGLTNPGLRTPGAACRTSSGEDGTWQAPAGSGKGWTCVPKPAAAPQQFFSTGAATGAVGASTPAAVKPTAPTLPNAPGAPTISSPREIGGSVPELAKLGGDYQTHLRNMESGAGYGMDVLSGAQKNTTEAQIRQARQAAAEQGIPFDEARMRAELQRGVYSAQATEKLGREANLTSAYAAAPEVIGADEAAKQGRWKIGQAGDVASNAARAAVYNTQAGIYNTQAGAGSSQYGTAANMYGSELSAATQSNQALLDFISRLYSGMMGSAGDFSQNYSYGG